MVSRSEPVYDVFVSYAKADSAWVDGYLLKDLENAGIRFQHEGGFNLGMPRLREFERAVQNSRYTLLVLTPAYLADHFNQYIDHLAQYHGLESKTWPVIPLILKPVELPLSLRFIISLEAMEQQGWKPALDKLIDFLGKEPVPPEPLPDPPYPGMQAFNEEYRGHFYGREKEVTDLVNLLRGSRALVLIGPSGSGKSSLVSAGLLPQLEKSKAFGKGGWHFLKIRPGTAPYKALSDALGGEPIQPENTVSALLSQHPGAQRLLLFVDQFEEFFTVSKEDTKRFQDALSQLSRLSNTFLILAARADFFPDLISMSLWQQFQKYIVLPLGEKELARAIYKPAEDVGVYVEPSLVERLVADAGGEPGILPFVQETMWRLWDKVEIRYLPVSAYETLVLTREAYDKIDADEVEVTGLKAAIGLHARDVMSGLLGESDDQKLREKQERVVRRIFLRLAQFGEGRSDTRRQQPISRLIGSTDPELFNQTISYLERNRLLTFSGSEDQKNKLVDIAHEALYEGWPALRRWLVEGRAEEKRRRRFEENVNEWLAKELPDNSFLYGGTQLAEIQDWAKENPEELNAEQQKFLDQSRVIDQRRKRTRLFLQGVVILFALVGLFATGYGIRYARLMQLAKGPLVNLGTFSIDKHEVTNGQYLRCMEAGRCLRPNEPADVVGIAEADENLPVVLVNAYQAAGFCQWIGRRLPTQAEWERAVHGTENRQWPWGAADPTPAHVNLFLPDFGDGSTGEKIPEGLVRVNDPAFAEGATPEGITHLIGNAREWTGTSSTCENGSKCPVWDGTTKVQALNVMGLAWTDDLIPDQAEKRLEPLPATPVFFDVDTGFRCADS